MLKSLNPGWFVFPLLVLVILFGLYLKFIDFPDVLSADNFAVGYFAAGNFSIGIFATGTFAIGLFSIGIFSIGIFSIGIFSVGFWSFAIFAYGLYTKRMNMEDTGRTRKGRKSFQ